MKKILVALLTFCSSLIALQSIAQPENWNWYFGYNAAINFSSGNPVVLAGDPMHQAEGSASISDAAGNLLFYSDGDSVWDNTHNLMPNGTGLMGHWSSTQSALIVPKPDSANIYYLFTAANNLVSTGIRYSEVDMTLNGGHGDITVKNIPLVTPACEKIVAVKHCNGRDYWVIAHDYYDNGYYAYLVTSAGVAAPVITHIGMVLNSSSNYIGYLKASPNSRKMATALEANGNFELYDFDNGTGILSNLITLYVSFNVGPYGVSFSPDNTKLYGSMFTNTGSSVIQYDITSNNQATILTTRYTVANSVNAYGSLLIGPDGKIYVAEYNNPSLSIIASPNSSGIACNFLNHALPLAPGISSFGLPNPIESFGMPMPSTYTMDTTLCATSLQLNATAIGSSYLWSNGATTNSISVTNSGTYWVQVQGANGCNTLVTVSDTFNVSLTQPLLLNLGPDSTFCLGDSILLDAGNAGSTYLWSNGATTQTIFANISGNYLVQVSNGACQVSDTININVISYNLPHSSFIVDTLSGCKPLLVHFTNTSSNATSFFWIFGGGGTSTLTNPVHSYSHSGNYTVTLIAYDTTACGVFTDTSFQTFYYTVFDPPQIPTISRNADTLSSSTAFQYQWFMGSTAITGATNQHYTITINGCYYVEITDTNGCTSKSDTICFVFDGIHEINGYNTLTLYPNPSNGSITITNNSGYSLLNYEFIVKDVLGQIIYSRTLKTNAANMQLNIPLSNGLYFWEIRNWGKTFGAGKLVLIKN